jgi:hypothetical protein
MVRVARLPVGKDDDPRLRFTNDTSDLEPVLPGVFNPPIGNVEGMTILRLKNLGCFPRLTSAVGSCTTAAHFALREVKDTRALALLRRSEQRPAAGLFHVVAMGCYR